MSEQKYSGAAFAGCDFVVRLEENRRGTPIRLLQLTDMQFIDAAQMRTPDRLRVDEVQAWGTDKRMAMCGNQIVSLVTQTKPDLIFITGDIVYGEFDDSGNSFEWFCDFMDGFGIPWAPVFGNHDNETARGVDWQCARFAQSRHCLFARGEVTGNGNYTVGIAVGDELVRVMHMVDSHGCLHAGGIYPDQLDLIAQNAAAYGDVPGFMAFHIPTECFAQAEKAKGYIADAHVDYTIGVDVAAKDGDFGACYERYGVLKTDRDFMAFLHDNRIDGVFVGHCHRINTCITYEGVKLVFGLKTGQYDYHQAGSLGGTLVTLGGDGFDVQHVPALVPLAPMPSGAPFLRDLLVKI